MLCSSCFFFTQELALGVVIECEYYLFGKGKSKLEEAISMGFSPPPLKSPFFYLRIVVIVFYHHLCSWERSNEDWRWIF